AARLSARGVTASAAALTAILARDAVARVPATLAAGATRAALGTAGVGPAAVSAVAARAADGVVKAMVAAKLKALGVAVVLAAGPTTRSSPPTCPTRPRWPPACCLAPIRARVRNWRTGARTGSSLQRTSLRR